MKITLELSINSPKFIFLEIENKNINKSITYYENIRI